MSQPSGSPGSPWGRCPVAAHLHGDVLIAAEAHRRQHDIALRRGVPHRTDAVLSCKVGRHYIVIRKPSRAVPRPRPGALRGRKPIGGDLRGHLAEPPPHRGPCRGTHCQSRAEGQHNGQQRGGCALPDEPCRAVPLLTAEQRIHPRLEAGGKSSFLRRQGGGQLIRQPMRRLTQRGIAEGGVHGHIASFSNSARSASRARYSIFWAAAKDSSSSAAVSRVE